jgi:hypothetical protein
VSVDQDDLVEHAADVRDEFAGPLPVEADPADVMDQKRAVPDADEDEYPS